ncbi:MAG: glycine zipper domain-containing protein [Phycisphaerales bacterium]
MNSKTTKVSVTALLAAAALAISGCNNAGEGALSGAGLGALGGLAIGSLTGSAGKGAAIGAVAGGIGGAVIGDQNQRKANQNTSTGW